MASMRDIKRRKTSIQGTQQITKAMELVASSKMRRAKERVEHSRPYFETLHDTLTCIAAADPRARSPYLRRAEIKRTLLVVIAGDRGLAGGYNSNVLKQAEAQQGLVTVLPIGKRSQEYFAHHGADLFTEWAEECEADEAIVLYSSFDTDASGGDGSLEPNTTYDDFQWILVRDNGGTWEVKTYGYG